MMWIVWLVLAALVVFVAVLLARAAAFKPRARQAGQAQPCPVDGQQAVEHLAQMVRIPTVSHEDVSRVDESQFEAFRALLRRLYPTVHATCELHRTDRTELLYHWKGRTADKPVVLMAHYDVVPVVEDQWQHPPFCGEVHGGELWGRGTLDTKITLLGILEAAEALMKQGFVPQQDVWFSFAGDEEVSGTGAPSAVAWLKEQGITPAMVVDEGGAVVEGVFPGVAQPMAVVGIGEKGPMTLTVTAKGAGGHSSMPPAHSAVGLMAKAVVGIEKHPFKPQLPLPVREMLDTVGRHAPFGLRVVFANLWCFGGLFSRLAAKMGGELGGMVRTTQCVTMAQGSLQSNVIPTEGRATLNLRLLNTTTPEQARQHVAAAAGPGVQVDIAYAQPASPYASTHSEAWARLAQAVEHTWPQAIVTPYLMMACSDSRHFSAICRDVYKFSAMDLDKEHRGLLHNHNERVPLPTVEKCVEFFTRLIRSL